MHFATNLLNSSQVLSLIKLAREAAVGVMKVYESAASNQQGYSEISLKSDGSPVTMADLLAHRIIVQGLGEISPAIPVVSEEDETSMMHRNTEGRFWLIDPLDGTKEFISRNGEFTINIALIESGQSVFGIVLAPFLDLLYWGGRGLGAFRERGGVTESLVSCDMKEDNRSFRVVASRSHMNEDTARYVAQLGACELIQAGSSLKFCRVAEGVADIYPRLGATKEWDTAAGQAIVEAVGGRVCTMDGKNLQYGKPEILNPHFIVLNKRSMEKLQWMGGECHSSQIQAHIVLN